MPETRVGVAQEIPAGKGKKFTVNGKPVAVFKVKGEFFAVDHVCLHRGGPLADGELEEFTVTCPFHGWQYDVRTGKCLTNPNAKLNSYPVHLKGEEIWVEM